MHRGRFLATLFFLVAVLAAATVLSGCRLFLGGAGGVRPRTVVLRPPTGLAMSVETGDPVNWHMDNVAYLGNMQSIFDRCVLPAEMFETMESGFFDVYEGPSKEPKREVIPRGGTIEMKTEVDDVRVQIDVTLTSSTVEWVFTKDGGRCVPVPDKSRGARLPPEMMNLKVGQFSFGGKYGQATGFRLR